MRFFISIFLITIAIVCYPRCEVATTGGGNPATPNSTDPNGGTGGTSNGFSGDTYHFHIAAGTGNSNWNSPASMIILPARMSNLRIRFYNDDSVTHALHTTNATPCSHGPTIDPGTSWDCMVGPGVEGTTGMYDHLRNPPNTKIWISTSGASLYDSYCSGCHGTLLSSVKRDKTAAQITNAINNQGSMSSLRNVFTAAEIQAIANILAAVP